MTYFLFAVLVVVIGVILYFHHLQSRDWREERAFLIQAAMARSLPELHSTQMPPAMPNFVFDEEDVPVGL